jgi:6 kDa early secretory antigenic target
VQVFHGNSCRVIGAKPAFSTFDFRKIGTSNNWRKHGTERRHRLWKERDMSAFQVTPEALAGVSSQLSSGASNIDQMLNTLRAQVSPIRDSWKGSANQSFEALWTEWQTSARQLHEALTGLAHLTGQASQAYAQTEQQIAGAFRS